MQEPRRKDVASEVPRYSSKMDKFVIRGGNPLVGTVRVSGAKNAALPAMAAAILTEEPLILEAIPDVRDIQTERKLLESMGAEVELGYGRAHHRTSICCRNLSSPEAKYELVKTMRASTLVLGPLVARMGVARVSLPGGCAIGARPIDLHIKGLEKMGTAAGEGRTVLFVSHQMGAVQALVPWLPSDLPRVENIGLHWPVVAVTAATLAAIEVNVKEICGIKLHLNPRTPIRNDSETVEHLAVDVHG